MPVFPYIYTNEKRPEHLRQQVPGLTTTTCMEAVMANSKSSTSALSAQPTLFDQETWKPVSGYEGIYEVSSKGRVRSLDRQVRVGHGATRTAPGKMLSPGLAGRGYPFVGLQKSGKCKNHYVHHLVAKAFVGEPPGEIGPEEGRYQVNHKNGDIEDNRPENLEWVTREGNTLHAKDAGLYLRGENLHSAKLTADEVREARRLRKKRGLSFATIGEKYGVSGATIRYAVRGKTWSHIQDPPPVSE